MSVTTIYLCPAIYVILCLLPGRSFATPTTTPSIASVADILERMAHPGSAYTFENQLAHQRERAREPGLSIAETTSPNQVTQLRPFVRLLHESFGLQFVLASAIDGLAVPIYSGLILDAERHPVANFRLVKKATFADVALQSIEVEAERLKAYSSDRAHFANVAFENLRTLLGLRDAGPTEFLELKSNHASKKFSRCVSYIQSVVALYDPGRPTWFFVDAPFRGQIGETEIARVKTLTQDEGVLAGVMLRQPGRVITIRHGKVVITPDAPSCGPTLAEEKK